MIKRKSIRVISLAVVVLLITQVGYRLFEREQTRRPPVDLHVAEQVFDSSDEGRATSAAPGPEQAPRSQPNARQSGLQQRLMAMTEPQRNQVFYLIIRDSGAKCTEVVSSQYMIAESSAWHAHCEQTRNYSIVIDELGGTSVHPIPYEDVAPAVIIEPQ